MTCRTALVESIGQTAQATSVGLRSAAITEDQLVQKLHDMREHGRALGNCETAMMHVFGVIFDDEIEASASNASRLAKAYEAKYGSSVGAPNISDGRKLKRFMTVNVDEYRRWRS